MTDPQKLFVGGLPWSLTDEEFSDAFAVFGEVVEAKVVMDRETNRSRGFGFVKYKDAGSAQTAKEEMDGADLKGRQIRVDFANQKPRGDNNKRRDDNGHGRAKRRRTRRDR